MSITCEKCGESFKGMFYYTRHINKKIPCTQEERDNSISCVMLSTTSSDLIDYTVTSVKTNYMNKPWYERFYNASTMVGRSIVTYTCVMPRSYKNGQLLLEG